MTAIKRAAYPRFSKQYTPQELTHFFAPTQDEINFTRQVISANYPEPQLPLMLLLKSFQKLGYLPFIEEVPLQVQEFVASQLKREGDSIQPLPRMTRTRLRQAIYKYLKIKSFGQGGKAAVEAITQQTARSMSDPADLINVAIEHLLLNHFELPSFKTLDELVNHVRFQVHQELYQAVAHQLTDKERAILDSLLSRQDKQTRYPFTWLKKLPATPKLKQIKEWEHHLQWLESILDPQPFISHLSSTKIEQFASQAYKFEVSDINRIAAKDYRHTLLLCLLHKMQVQNQRSTNNYVPQANTISPQLWQKKTPPAS